MSRLADAHPHASLCAYDAMMARVREMSWWQFSGLDDEDAEAVGEFCDYEDEQTRLEDDAEPLEPEELVPLMPVEPIE